MTRSFLVVVVSFMLAILWLSFSSAVAHALKLTVRPWEVCSADDFEKVFAGLRKERPGGLYVPGGGALINANEKRIIALALKSQLPSMLGNKRAVETGGLMSYGADLAESYRRVAYFVDRILKGAQPPICLSSSR